MIRGAIRVLVSAVLLTFLFSTCSSWVVAASREEILMGYVTKRGKGFVIEADDGDYIVKGKDVSKLADKLVEATGIITESDKGDMIEVRSIQDVQDTQPD
jgi:hypothetical protein